MTRKKPSETHEGEGKHDDAAAGHRFWRETIESIVIAVILAFLFRGFEAEAFVIPTGSMAPTLMGRHIDVKCPQCGYRYQTGASGENSDEGQKHIVTATTCPICRYELALDRPRNQNQNSFSGDRILVNKFAYEFGAPQRWDVIVFKFPGNARINYIKRLIGLPGESILIDQGDIYTLTREEYAQGVTTYHIARKPPHKMTAMLQLVDDTDYIAQAQIQLGWPSRWQQWSTPENERSWKVGRDDDRSSFAIEGGSDEEAWLRYRHLIPWPRDWDDLEDGQLPSELASYPGCLITDYYTYNDGVTKPPGPSSPNTFGTHWVGDLALECNVEVLSDTGELLLDLVEGGTHYRCTINVADGTAVLSNDDQEQPFIGNDGATAETRTAQTRLKGRGRYRLRFSNVDDELRLWVNDRVVRFDGPTTYQSPGLRRPHWSPNDAGDLEPLGVGSRGADLRVSRLRVLRDVYYIAAKSNSIYSYSDYEQGFGSEEDTREAFSSPESWERDPRFGRLRNADFPGTTSNGEILFLGPDHFLPLGDNSPQSQDARLWAGAGIVPGAELPPWVERRLLIGKAVMIYWPHHWRWPTPCLPNFKRMGLIR